MDTTDKADWLALLHLGKSAEYIEKFHSQSLFPDAKISQAVAEDLEWEDKSTKHHIITYDDENYPPLLKEIKGSPPALFVYGSSSRLKFPAFGIVGPRMPSREGVKNAALFSSYIAQQGICIVSGLAYGIDKVAHESSINKLGKTIAVIGTGIEVTYPARHNYLVEQIADNDGSVVSIFPRPTKPLPPHFPARNRIISGISLGVLVVEAGERSGAMITARCAIEQGREVFALPGSIHNPLAKGSNSLIKQGANLTENYPDIINHLQPVYESYGMAVKPIIHQEHQEYKAINKNNHKPKNHKQGTLQNTKATKIAKVTSDNESTKDYVTGIESIGNIESPDAELNLLKLESKDTEILKLLNKGGLSADELVELVDSPISQINSSLMNMELQGAIYQEKGVYKRVLN